LDLILTRRDRLRFWRKPHPLHSLVYDRPLPLTADT